MGEAIKMTDAELQAIRERCVYIRKGQRIDDGEMLAADEDARYIDLHCRFRGDVRGTKSNLVALLDEVERLRAACAQVIAAYDEAMDEGSCEEFLYQFRERADIEPIRLALAQST